MPLIRSKARQHIVGRRYFDRSPDGTSVYRWQAPSGRRKLAQIRMLLSVFGELSNIGSNWLDHTVRLVERLSFREMYLPNRLLQYEGQKRLAVLLPGYAQGRAAFETMERVLSSPIFGIFPVVLSYQPYSQDIRRSAQIIEERLSALLERTDADEIAFIGHSQGGLVIRELVQRRGLTDKVRQCIFLATPHMGTWAGTAGYLHRALTKVATRLLPRVTIEGESALQMVPGSAYLNGLNALPLPQGIRYTNIYNYIDPMVWPASYARLPYPQANNVLVMKIGHLQTLYDLQELELILRSLLLDESEQADFPANVLGAQVLEARDIEADDGASYEEVVASSG